MITDYDLYDIEQQQKIAHRPVCCCCEQHIQDGVGFYINEEWYCKDCMQDEFEHDLEIEFDER